MFGEQFYPTPKELAKELLKDIVSWRTLLSGKFRVLDPSAGAGDFLDAVKEYGIECLKSSEYWTSLREEKNLEHFKSMASAIEIDGNLQSILLGKGYNVINDDFLSHRDRNFYDLVVMNPPFANGDEHLLHAWETLEFKNLVCILNAQTIRNPYSAKRKLLANIIKDNGFKVEFKENAFSDADRKTDVEIAIIYMTKKQVENIFDDLDAERMKEDIEDHKKSSYQELAKPDTIKSLVDRYNASIDEYISFRKACRRMNNVKSLWTWDNYNRNEFGDDNTTTPDTQQLQNFKDRLTSAAWNTVFRMTDFESRMTNRIKEEFRKNRAKAGQMAFTEKNIYIILELLFANSSQIAVDCILDVFDDFTKHHEENRVYFEGWKTNDAYEVGKKVILPCVVELDYNYVFEVKYYYWDKIKDIDRAIAFVAGIDYNKMVESATNKSIEQKLTIMDAVRRHGNQCKEDKATIKDKFESEFFIIKCFKKGTIHLEFKDLELKDRFNRLVAKERGWLKAWDGKNKRSKTKDQQTTSKELTIW